MGSHGIRGPGRRQEIALVPAEAGVWSEAGRDGQGWIRLDGMRPRAMLPRIPPGKVRPSARRKVGVTRCGLPMTHMSCLVWT